MDFKVSQEEIDSWLAKGIAKTYGNGNENPSNEDNVENKLNQKRVTMVDYKKLAAQYKVEVSEVEAKVEALLKEIKENLPDETDDIYEFLVNQKIGEKFRKSGKEALKEKNTKIEGTFIGVSSRKDANNNDKIKCWTTFKNAPNEAIKEKHMAVVKKMVSSKKDLTEALGKTDPYVAVNETHSLWYFNKGEWVDTKFTIKTFDEKKGRNIPTFHKAKKDNGDDNPLYGFPIPFKYQREAFFFDDAGILHKVKGDLRNIRIGYNSTIWGNISNVSDQVYKTSINIPKVFDKEEGELYEDTTPRKNMWKLAEDMYQKWYQKYNDKETGKTVKLGHLTLNEVRDLPSYGYYVLRGYVNDFRVSDPTENGGQKMELWLKDDEGTTVKSSTWYQGIVDISDELCKGDEVIIMIERVQYQDDREKDERGYGVKRTRNELMGIVRNTVDVSEKSKALQLLNERLSKKND